MNTIKYSHPDGRTARVKIAQPSYRILIDSFNGSDHIQRRLRTMAEADEQANRQGFSRAGLRWNKSS